MTDFGEAFAVKTLRRTYANAVFPAITNTNYEGELKRIGDRLNILSFPGDVQTLLVMLNCFLIVAQAVITKA